MKLTEAEELAIRNIVYRVREETAEKVATLNGSDDQKKAAIAQNVFSAVFTVVGMEMAPFGQEFCLSLACRLASYAVSMAPVEDQRRMMKKVCEILPGEHRRRIKAGIMIPTVWE